MRRTGVVAALMVPLLLGVVAGASADEDITVAGEIVDLACYLAKGKKGPEHKSCAQMCAKGGTPIGVLTDAGEVYLLIDDHSNPSPYESAKKLAGGNAEVSGKKFVKPGIASIMVTGVKPL